MCEFEFLQAGRERMIVPAPVGTRGTDIVVDEAGMLRAARPLSSRAG
jgi:hypothetical protein